MPKEMKVVAWSVEVVHHLKGFSTGFPDTIEVPEWYVANGLEDTYLEYKHLEWCRNNQCNPSKWEWKAYLVFTAITEEDLSVW